jgi:hypothetical protein
VRVVVSPRESEKLWANPLVSEPARDIEPVRVLNRETWSPNVEPSPRETDSPCEKPFTSEPARDNEPVSVLMMELCSATVEDEPSAPVKISA